MTTNYLQPICSLRRKICRHSQRVYFYIFGIHFEHTFSHLILTATLQGGDGDFICFENENSRSQRDQDP